MDIEVEGNLLDQEQSLLGFEKLLSILTFPMELLSLASTTNLIGKQ